MFLLTNKDMNESCDFISINKIEIIINLKMNDELDINFPKVYFIIIKYCFNLFI